MDFSSYHFSIAWEQGWKWWWCNWLKFIVILWTTKL